MAIKKPAKSAAPKENPQASAFINAAPDGRAEPASRRRKIPISFSLPAPLLDALDAHAEATGQSRAFVLNMALMEYLDRKGKGHD